MALSLQQLLTRLSFRQMQVFQAVYQHKGYRKAAEYLGLTQPAVSSQMRHLENALEQPLFEYIGRQLYCTQAGERVASFIEAMFEQMSELQTELNLLKEELSGDLQLSVVSSAQSVVPYLLSSFLDEFPAVNVHIDVVNRAQALERLKLNIDDLVIMAMVPEGRSLSTLPFLDNQLIPVLPAQHPLNAQPVISAKQFFAEPMLIRENGSGTRYAVEHHCQQHRLQLKPIMEMSSNESIKHAVIAGLGVGILPKLSVMAELQTGILKTLELQDFPIRRSWCLVHPMGKYPSRVAQAFIDHVYERLEQIHAHFKNA
ncbi:LysR family transcriptional regulator [Methylophaga pinxianii]|uniref:LysR family transcriptional regulator n=1 Tax=Methylophaga pinxianii TaxID=2881052 RepID=UPI001CF4D079|nr:LysR family transcriptional regulator [Methylophaga pinxianii]MCB2426647.1 LysR family transcriptional regulator [Methylophaga pinxianii]UPH45093.1 LysR family transcriptional regulator [Methylophaga pinxianii]